MFSLKLVSLLLLVVEIAVVASQDCASLPDPVRTSSAVDIIEVVDCHRGGYAGPGDTTGDGRSLVIYLYNCATVPVGLFVDVSAELSAVAVVSEDCIELREGTFEGLENVAELRLQGFRTLRYLDRTVFRPLRSLERLILAGFGAETLSYVELGDVLYELSGTPLRTIVLHEIHSIENVDKTVNITALFRLRNVTVKELTFSNNIITGISGQLSASLPDLTYVCIGTNAHYYAAIKVVLDAWLFLPGLRNMTVYSVPVPDSLNVLPCGGMIPELDSSFVHITLALLRHRDDACYQGVRFPLPPELEQLTIHQVKLTKDRHQEYKPFCFNNNNSVEHFDAAGSILPSNSTLITGLVNLRYLNLQNTGITTLPGDFLSYFSKLERLNLVQLSIGQSINHINSSFFGRCRALREIHLGDCQITNIPSDALVLLPSLEILNLSSNSLQTFDVRLSNNRNLSHLNLSDNAISTLSDEMLAELNAIARSRLERTGETLTVDVRRNPLSCLCDSIQFVRQLHDWVANHEVNVPGFDEHRCLYVNGSVLALARVDTVQAASQCDVLRQLKNASDCPCNDDLRERLERVRLSLQQYVCRNYEGKLVPMSDHPLPSCPDFFSSATFVVPVVVGGVLALILAVTLFVLYRHRRNERLSRIVQRLGSRRIVRLGIHHVMARNRCDDPADFRHDVFLYLHDSDQDTARRWFDAELAPHRSVVGQDDFRVGLKLETLLENVRTCRWLVPVLSPCFVDDGECRDFVARAQYSRPHAVVPVVWETFSTDDLTINNLLDTAEPVTWPGDRAADAAKAQFWRTLLERTSDTNHRKPTCTKV